MKPPERFPSDAPRDGMIMIANDRELPARVADWIDRLQAEGIRGADLVFACIGPALEIFSRYRAVETAEGDLIGLPDYLEKVWEVVGRAALQQVLGPAEAQQTLFPDQQDSAPTLVQEPSPHYGEPPDEPLSAALGDTTLDRVHTAMLLQSSGHANALRTLTSAEQDRGPDFLRLANALSALYPQGSPEKRLLNAMLLAVPR